MNDIAFENSFVHSNRCKHESYSKKTAELKHMYLSDDPDILLITETWLHAITSNDEVRITFSEKTATHEGRGLAMVLKKEIDAHRFKIT